MSDDIKKLELRITELENQLKSLGGGTGQQQANIDPEDMKVFQKVSQQLGISGCINECQPIKCITCFSCYICSHCITCFKCINECICGPCSLCSIGGTGGSRFGSLG
jgi:hypothetical protein